MNKQIVGKTKNGKQVYVDVQHSHAATHIADTPDLLKLVQESIANLSPTEDNIYADRDVGPIATRLSIRDLGYKTGIMNV